MKKLIICLLVSCCIKTASAQQVNNIFFNWNAGNSNYPDYFLAEDIAQEKNGVLWLAGRDGLLRFDGHHFQAFKSEVFDSSTIPGNFIAAQLIDENYLYGGTFSTGFFVMDLQNFSVKRIPLLGKETGLKFTASAIVLKNKDSLWVACSKKQLICVSKKTFAPNPNFSLKPLPGNEIDSGTIFTIQPSQKIPGKLWLITNKSILLADAQTGSYTTHRFTVKDSNGQGILLENPTSIVEESDSTALIGFFKRGILQWNFKKNTWQHFLFEVNAPRLTNNIINHILWKGGSEYFVASSDSGLYIFNSLTGQFTKDARKADNQMDVFREPARSLFTDKYGGTWISGIGSISYWHPAYQSVKKFAMPAGFAPTVASSVQQYNNKIVITRRDTKNPLAVFNTEKNRWLSPVPNSATGDYVRIKIPYRNNYIYQTVNGNWRQYNDEKQQLQPYTNGPALLATDKNITGLDENEHLIVYTSYNGLYVYNKQNALLSHHKSSEAKDSLHARISHYVKIDKQNNAWFASLYGLGMYNSVTKTFKEFSFRTNPHWPGLRVVSDLQLSKTGLLYAATQDDGVYVFDTRTQTLKTHYNKDYLLHENFVNNILFDSAQQYLWVATLSGLNVIDIAGQYSKRWDKYNSGFAIGDGFFGLAVLRNNEVFCADSVLYNFSIGDLRRLDLKPFVSGYIAEKKYHNATGDIRLDQDVNYIELFISTGFFADNAHANIEYRLSDKDDWNKVDNGKITIPSIKNGKTHVQLRALLEGTIYGSGESSIVIKRALYYYQTWWFFVLITLLAAAIIYLLFSSRIKQVRKQEREKTSLQGKINELEVASLRSQMNPHFIFNTLSSLRYLVLTGENKKASAFILKLSKLLRMVLNNSVEATIPLQDELEALELYLEIETLRFDNGFSYSINVEPQVETFGIRVPPMLLQPFAENAIKHGLTNSSLPDKWLMIHIANKPGNCISFSITDNGIGRTNAALLNAGSTHRSMGMQLTNQRIMLFNNTGNAHISCSFKDYRIDKEHPGTIAEITFCQIV